MKKYLSVMGIPFEVEFVKKVDKDNSAGECYGPRHQIKVSTSQNTTEQLKESTLLHEFLHAVLFVSGQSEHLSDEQEEAIVLAFEHALYGRVALDLKDEPWV